MTPETTAGPTPRSRSADQWRVWYGLLGGPHWWAMHLGLSYLAVPHVCASGRTWMLWALSVATVLGAISAVLVSASVVRRARGDSGDDLAAVARADRDLGLGVAGLAVSAFFLAVMVMERLPVLFIDPCLQV